MSDIALVWNNNVADAAIDGADLLADDGLETAAILSLFCDASLPPGQELPDESGDRRGWWADSFADISGDNTGSLLWTLRREKRVAETLERARRYAIESLNWMIEDGAAAALSVVTSFAWAAELGSARYPDEWFLVIEIAIDRPAGDRESFRYAYNWQQQLVKRI